MATVGQLRAVISLDDRQFQQGMQRSAGSMERLADTAERTGRRVKSGLDDAFKDAAGAAPGALQGIGNAFSSLGNIAGSALQGVFGLFQSLSGVVLNVAGQIAGTLANAFQSALTAAGALAATAGGALAAALVKVGQAGLDFNATMAQGRVALTAVLGSTEAAGKGMANFQRLAEDSLMSLKDVTGQGAQLARAYGREGFGQVIPTLKAFDAAAKVNQLSIDNTRNALLQFRQLIQRDFAQQEELSGIGENLGVNVAGILRKALGSADTEALKAAGVTSKQVAKALVDGINAELGTQAAQLGRTLPIVLSGFEDTFAKIAGKVTEAFGPRLTAALDSILTQFNRLADNGSLIRALEVPFTLVSKAIEAVGAALPNVVDWIGQIATQENVVNLLANVGGWFKTIADEVLRFVGAASGGATLGQIFTTFGSIAEKAIDGVLRGWNVLVSSIKFLADHAGEIWQVFTDAMGPAQKALDTLIGGVVMLGGLVAGGKVADLFGGFGGVAATVGAGLGFGANKGPAPTGGGGGFNPFSVFKPFDTSASVEKLLGQWFKPSGAVTAAKPAGGFGADAVTGLLGQAETLGKSVREAVGKGAGEALGKLPDRVKGLFNGFQAQAQQAWQSGGLDTIKKQQEANAARIREGLNGIINPKAAGLTDAIAPGHVMGQPAAPAGAGGGAVLADPKAAKEAEKRFEQTLAARQGAFDALLAQARAMAEAALPGQKAQTELDIVMPALRAKLQELSAQALALLPAARTSADKARDYWATVREGWSVQEQMTQLQGRAQAEADAAVKAATDRARKAVDEARKAANERLKVADLLVQLNEAQLKNMPGLNDRQKRQALVPSLLNKFAELHHAAPGENHADRISRQLGIEQVKTQVLEAAGIMSGGRLTTGRANAALAFRQLDQIAAQAVRLPTLATPQPAAGSAALQQHAAPYGAPGVKISQNQMVITLPPSHGDLSESDFRRFYDLYRQARRRESREAGLVGPAY